MMILWVMLFCGDVHEDKPSVNLINKVEQG